MKHCHHSQWLRLHTRGHHTELRTFGRLQRLIESIPDPDVQTPSLVVLVGNVSKAAALRESFGVRRLWHGMAKRARGEVHLHVDPSSVLGKPLLVADGDPLTHPIQKAPARPASTCHETTTRAIHRPAGIAVDDLVSGLFGRLLFPFADVFCFFCEDLGGLQSVARLLAAWLDSRSGAAQSAAAGHAQPSVLLVTEAMPMGRGDDANTRSAFLRELRLATAKNALDYVAAVDVVALLPKRAVSTGARYRLLKERLLDGSDGAQNRRHEAGLSFSATHLAALVECGLDAFVSQTTEPFCCIKASRTHSPVAPDLALHLRTLVDSTQSASDLANFAAPVMASSFLLDSYPPGAHRKSASSTTCLACPRLTDVSSVFARHRVRPALQKAPHRGHPRAGADLCGVERYHAARRLRPSGPSPSPRSLCHHDRQWAWCRAASGRRPPGHARTLPAPVAQRAKQRDVPNVPEAPAPG
jgi:hypothetical protein